MITLGVLVSGRGSNLQAIIDAIDRAELDARIALVISNHASVLALERAAKHGIEAKVLVARDFPSRLDQQLRMAQEFKERGVELVVNAGFDRILLPEFLHAFPWRIINVHPSLLPAFGGGLHAQQEAWEHGVRVSGATVHFVTEDVDSGPIILQAAVPVLDDDTPDSLAARVLEQEHRILPRAIRLIAEGRVKLEGRRVRIGAPTL
jgi:phosphoribosylglycinamide formyltransferase-1